MDLGRIPDWAKDLITEEEVGQIAHQVAMVEKKTSCEIVPVVLLRSLSRYMRIYWVIGRLFQFLMMVWTAGLLITYLTYDLPLNSLQILAFESLISGIVFVQVLTFWPWVQRRILAHPDIEELLLQRARLEFYESGIHKTQRENGVLVLVSLSERRAFLLCGAAINAQIPAHTWTSLMDRLVVQLRENRLGQGLAETVEQLEPLLTRHFPIEHNDTNELCNQVVFRES